jgi:pimeloyl-ACP methyl ester carboxylesterase
VRLPDVTYARSGEVAIAYQLVGDGPTDIVFVRGITGDLLSTWEQPMLVRHVEGLAAFGRVLMLDKRGTGLSDRVREVQSLDTTMDDVRAVMDAAGSESAVLWSGNTSTGLSVLFAATYPDRCIGLALFDPRIRGTRAPDYPWAATPEEWRQQLAEVRAGWGERTYLEGLAREWAPEVADDAAFRDWFVWHMRRSLSPGAAMTAFRTAMELDVSDVLAAVRVPTLILPHPLRPGPAAYTAERIRGAEIAVLPAFAGVYTWVHDGAHAATMAATERFVSRLSGRTATERVLATILFTDIVGSTDLAARLGDTAWRELLERHHAIVRRELARFHGRELDTAGMGSSPRSTGPRGPSRLRRLSANHSPRSASTCGRASTPASARSATARSSESQSRSALASHRSPGPARCSSRGQSGTSWPGQGYASRIAVSINSRGSLTPGTCLRSYPPDSLLSARVRCPPGAPGQQRPGSR